MDRRSGDLHAFLSLAAKLVRPPYDSVVRGVNSIPPVAKTLGVLPTQLPDAVGYEPASDYLDFKERPGLPFDRAIHLAS